MDCIKYEFQNSASYVENIIDFVVKKSDHENFLVIFKNQIIMETLFKPFITEKLIVFNKIFTNVNKTHFVLNKYILLFIKEKLELPLSRHAIKKNTNRPRRVYASKIYQLLEEIFFLKSPDMNVIQKQCLYYLSSEFNYENLKIKLNYIDKFVVMKSNSNFKLLSIGKTISNILKHKIKLDENPWEQYNDLYDRNQIFQRKISILFSTVDYEKNIKRIQSFIKEYQYFISEKLSIYDDKFKDILIGELHI